MAWKTHILVIANLTVGSDTLLNAMRAGAARAPAQFRLIVPQRNDGTRAGDEAVCRVERAIERLVEVSLNMSVCFGHGEPVVAALENYDPRRFGKILVCTFRQALRGGCRPARHRLRRIAARPGRRGRGRLPACVVRIRCVLRRRGGNLIDGAGLGDRDR